jgi:hypothetical protein
MYSIFERDMIMIPTAMVDLEESYFMRMFTTNFVLRLQNRFVLLPFNYFVRTVLLVRSYRFWQQYLH